MGLLGDVGNAFSGALQGIADGANNLDKALNSQNLSAQDFQKDGFIIPPIPNADGNGLPSNKIPSQRLATFKRNIIHWFVPEIGVVNMYINPQSINYGYKKLIQKERTKGGFSVQMWGEELPTLSISGNTGSSGIEGLNVLYEIYRAEQYVFDPVALTMAADSSITGLNDIIDSALGNLGSFGSTISNSTIGLLGLGPASQNVLPRDVPSLASLAAGIEMYYLGKVYRGYFESMTVKESVDRLGLFDYDLQFTVTQIRGYRTNNFAWQRSAIDGPSNNGVGGTPLSFADLLPTNNRIAANPTVANSGRGPFSQ